MAEMQEILEGAFAALVSNPNLAQAVSAIATALAALFAAASGGGALLAIFEMRRARRDSLRPVLGLTTHAWEIEYEWRVRGNDVLWPGRNVRYWADAEHRDVNGPSAWGLSLVLANLSDHPATNIRITCELRPNLSPNKVAKLGLGKDIGGNPEQRLEHKEGRYFITSATKGSAGWYSSFSVPLQAVPFLRGGSEHAFEVAPHLIHSLALLLYREARVAGAAKSAEIYRTPYILLRLSYDTVGGETVFNRYLLTLPIQTCNYELLNGARYAAERGVRDEWEVFSGSVRPALFPLDSGLPRRLSSRPVRKVLRQTHPASIGHFGIWRDQMGASPWLRVRRLLLELKGY